MQGKGVTSWVTFTIVAAVLGFLLLALLGLSYFFYRKTVSLDKESKKAHSEVRDLEKQVETLKLQLKVAQKGSKEEIIYGNTPEQVVQMALKKAGYEPGYQVGKYVVSLRSVNDKEAVVWAGPFASEFIMEFKLVKFQGIWQIESQGGISH